MQKTIRISGKIGLVMGERHCDEFLRHPIGFAAVDWHLVLVYTCCLHYHPEQARDIARSQKQQHNFCVIVLLGGPLYGVYPWIWICSVKMLFPPFAKMSCIVIVIDLLSICPLWQNT